MKTVAVFTTKCSQVKPFVEELTFGWESDIYPAKGEWIQFDPPSGGVPFDLEVVKVSFRPSGRFVIIELNNVAYYYNGR